MKLEVDSVYYQVREKVILSDVHLSIETGEVIGVLGRNGSGKSPLFKLMFGLANAESFQLRIDGVRHKNAYERDLLQYLPQQDFLPDHFSLKKALQLFDIQTSWQQKIFDTVEESGHQSLGSLSGGKRRLFEVMLLLYSEVPFLILDEPFTGLTPIMVEQLSELIRERANKKGIIITDHIYRSIVPICDRFMLMKAGTLKQISSIEDLEDEGYLSCSK